MNNEPDFENLAERIVRWAADHPLSAEEVEQRYAHLLKGLAPLPAPEWSGFRLGRWAVRYWKEKVDDLQEAVDAATALPLGVGARGGAAPASAAASEHTLRADGPGAVACAKLTASAASADLSLALWLEPKAGGASPAFSLTVLGAEGVTLTGPLSCAPGSVVRFAGIEPGSDYRIVFEHDAERWEIRWGFTDTTQAAGNEA